MKRLIVAGFVLGALAAPALAADLQVKGPILKAPAAIYSWTGCYVGGNGGLKWGRFSESVDVPRTTGTILGNTFTVRADHIDLDNLHSSSGAVGGQIGCRSESNAHFIVGFEGDFDWTNLHGTVTNNAPGFANTFVPGDFFGNQAHWQSSARLLFGHAWDRVFIYTTGGIAFTRVSMDANFIASSGICVLGNPCPYPASSGADAKTLAGVTAGGGGAYAFDKNWSLGAEYRYTAYQKADFALGGVAGLCGTPVGPPVAPVCFNQTVTGHKSLQTQEVLFKLNYQFDGGLPLLTRY
jgi:outer membrane immunogenic protein